MTLDLETIKARLEQKAHELTVAEVVSMAHDTAKLKGWWENMDRNVPEQLALMHSEISEALEEFRGSKPLNAIYCKTLGQPPGDMNKPEGFGIELADCIIRIADTCARYGIDLEACLRTKMLYNLSRPHRHGGKVC